MSSLLLADPSWDSGWHDRGAMFKTKWLLTDVFALSGLFSIGKRNNTENHSNIQLAINYVFASIATCSSFRYFRNGLFFTILEALGLADLNISSFSVYSTVVPKRNTATRTYISYTNETVV